MENDEFGILQSLQGCSAEVFTEYKPSERIGKPHPEALCVADSLAWVDPPTIHYGLVMSAELYYGDDAIFSCAQVEAIRLICQIHERFFTLEEVIFRKGFLIGDGTGVGKSRTIAGVLIENWLNTRKKAIWVTANKQLFKTCKEELKLAKLPISIYEVDYDVPSFTEGVMLLTYSALSSKVDMIIAELKEDFDGVIVFDECHYAKRSDTKTATAFAKLQNSLPYARIVYSSATAGSDPEHLRYLTRLNLWGSSTSFKTAKELIDAIRNHENGALELLCIEMKKKGQYLARQISLHNVQFTLIELKSTLEFEEVYSRCCQLVTSLLVYGRTHFEGVELLRVMRAFWGHVLRLFQSLTLSSKIDSAVRLALEKKDNAIIFGMRHTGDSQFGNFLEMSKDSEPYSNAEYIFRGIFALLEIPLSNRVDYHTMDKSPTTKKSRVELLCNWPEGSIGSYTDWDPTKLKCEFIPEDVPEEDDLQRMFFNLKPFLPLNPIDYLIDKLGGYKNVAEITGRKRAIQRIDGSNAWTKNENQLGTNLSEMKHFMNGTKRFCIITDVGSVGFSLHAKIGQKQRIHITLEYAYSAEKVLQQLGRSHRSNQSSCPLYYFFSSPIPAEIRFSEIVSKRLSQLGAICHAEANTNPLINCGFTGLLFTATGENAVANTVEKLLSQNSDVSEALKLIGLMKKKEVTTKLFLNRTLALPLSMQKACLTMLDQELFECAELHSTKLLKEYPPRGLSMDIKLARSQENTLNVDGEEARIGMLKFLVSRLASWDDVKKIGKPAIFWIRDGKVLCGRRLKSAQANLEVFCPYNRNEVLISEQKLVSQGWKTVDEQTAFTLWNDEFEAFKQTIGCSHVIKNGECKIKHCDYGWGRKYVYMLTGQVISVWASLCEIIKPMKLVRVTCNIPENKYLGVLIESDQKDIVRECLNTYT